MPVQETASGCDEVTYSGNSYPGEVSVRTLDSYAIGQGYQNAVMWFPDKWSGTGTLLCTWETAEVNPVSWPSCVSPN